MKFKSVRKALTRTLAIVSVIGTISFLLIPKKTFYKPFTVGNPTEVNFESNEVYTRKEQRFYDQISKTLRSSVKNYDYQGHSLQEIIEFIDTPEKAAIFCVEILPKGKSIKRSNLVALLSTRFSKAMYGNTYDCRYATIAAANLLRDNGFPPYGLIIFDKRGETEHMVYVYKDIRGRVGVIGANKEDFVPPVAKSIESLAIENAKENNFTYQSCVLVDLDKLMPQNHK